MNQHHKSLCLKMLSCMSSHLISTLRRNIIRHSSVRNERFLSTVSSSFGKSILSSKGSVAESNSRSYISTSMTLSSLCLGDRRRDGIRSLISPKYEYFYSSIAGAVDVKSDYVFKGVFRDESRAKDFLTNILIGDKKILPKGTKIEKIKYLPNEHIQNMNENDAKKMLFDLQIQTSHGIYIIEMQRNYVPKKNS